MLAASPSSEDSIQFWKSKCLLLNVTSQGFPWRLQMHPLELESCWEDSSAGIVELEVHILQSFFRNPYSHSENPCKYFRSKKTFGQAAKTTKLRGGRDPSGSRSFSPGLYELWFKLKNNTLLPEVCWGIDTSSLLLGMRAQSKQRWENRVSLCIPSAEEKKNCCLNSV